LEDVSDVSVAPDTDGPSGVILTHERVSLIHPAGVIRSRPASEGRSDLSAARDNWPDLMAVDGLRGGGPDVADQACDLLNRYARVG
jgi:hypothetical protein